MVGQVGRLRLIIRSDRPLNLLRPVQQLASVHDKRIVSDCVGATRQPQILFRHVAEMLRFGHYKNSEQR
jgi:hypothetical protein